MIRECCVCKRIEEKGTWAGNSVSAGKHAVTHVYCPECFGEMMDEVDRFFTRKACKKVFCVVEGVRH